MKKLSALLIFFAATAAFALEPIEVSLTKIDHMLKHNLYEQIIKNCDKSVVFSKGDTRLKVEYTVCNDEKIEMLYKGGKKLKKKVGTETITRTEYYKHNGNMVRAFLSEMVKESNGLLTMDRFSVYEIEADTYSLKTKKGWADFNTLKVWVMLDYGKATEKQIHLTIANDAGLPYTAQLLDVYAEGPQLNTEELIEKK